MKKENENINVEEVVSSIKNLLKETKEGLDPSQLSKADGIEVKEAIEQNILLAYQLKLRPYLKDLKETSPDLPVRNVIMKLLAHIKPDTSVATIVKVVEYIGKQWEDGRLKMAA